MDIQVLDWIALQLGELDTDKGYREITWQQGSTGSWSAIKFSLKDCETLLVGISESGDLYAQARRLLKQSKNLGSELFWCDLDHEDRALVTLERWCGRNCVDVRFIQEKLWLRKGHFERLILNQENEMKMMSFANTAQAPSFFLMR
jgi:hypothetical protein